MTGGVGGLPFRQVWIIDTEFIAAPGERPAPVCLVAKELRSGRTVRLWRDALRKLSAPPYPTGPDSLIVAYFASAELGVHLALGWPMPVRVLDLYVEFRAATNGLTTPAGNSLLGALAAHGLSGMSAGEKDAGRELVMAGGPWSADDRQRILDYCEADVGATARLLGAMVDRIDLPRALIRGRHMAAVATMEHTGVPIDTDTLDRLRAGWDGLKLALVERIDADYGVYEGVSFKADRLDAYLARRGIAWPRLPSGQLKLDDVTFRDRARAHPELEPLRGLRHSLSQLRLQDLAVGRDGRNRVLLSPFATKTGRNAPSNTKFVFGPSAWLRGLIKPPPGHGLAYVDWSAQEHAIAAALSGDPMLIAAYQSGDPYLAFGRQIGAVPADATKATHRTERDLFKVIILATQYGQGPESLAAAIGRPVIEARELLRRHRETYRVFWKWLDGMVDSALLTNTIKTVFGWPLHLGPGVNPRSLQNFPMQAHGSEMLRLACCLATERGIEVCAPVHDALLICAPLDRLDHHLVATRAAMAEAARIVLGGFELRTGVELVRYPDRYADPRGAVMWATIMELLEKCERQAA